MSSKQFQRTAISLACSSLLLGSAAFAQEQPARRDTLNVLIEEVIVSARKREEGLQDAPISLSAFSGEGLEARGIDGIAEIGQITPNMNYQNNPVAGGSSSVATVYVRGIGQRDFLGTIDNGVGFYIDDVLIARTVGAVIDLVDVERVEILRGPQGTLFGRNNIGGAIKLHSAKPAEEFGGYVSGELGTDSLYRIRASVDAPISDTLGSKFTLMRAEQDGYVDRPAGGDLGNKDMIALRAAFRFEPSEDLSFDLSYDYTDEDDNGPAFTLKDAGELAPGGFPGFHNNVLNPTDCGYPTGLFSTNPLCYNSPNYVSDSVNYGTAPTYSKTETSGIRFGIDWQLNENHTLRSITARRDLDAEFARDSDASPNRLVHFYDDFEAEQFSTELQLVSTLFDDKLDLITGVYYFDEDGENVNLLEFAIAQFTSGSAFETQSQAVFTQGTWHVNDKLDVTLGLRYTEEEKTFTPDQTAGPNFIGIPYPDGNGNCLIQNEPANLGNGTPGLIVTIPGSNCPVRLLPEGTVKKNTEEFTPMLNVAYNFSEQFMGYATYSEGFRSGGFVQRVFPPLPINAEFDPEYVDSYEIGGKYQTNDGTMRLNFALFYTEYTDIQVRTERPGFVGELEDNIGDSEIKGLELELTYSLAPSTVLELAYGYTDAEYTDIRVEAPLQSTVQLDDTFDHVPEHTLSGAISHEFSLDNGSALIFRVDASHTTEYANDPDNSLPIWTPEVTLVNASFRWLSPTDRYNVSLGVKNLTDEKYLLSGYLNEAIGHVEAIYDRGAQWYLNTKITF